MGRPVSAAGRCVPNTKAVLTAAVTLGKLTPTVANVCASCEAETRSGQADKDGRQSDSVTAPRGRTQVGGPHGRAPVLGRATPLGRGVCPPLPPCPRLLPRTQGLARFPTFTRLFRSPWTHRLGGGSRQGFAVGPSGVLFKLQNSPRATLHVRRCPEVNPCRRARVSRSTEAGAGLRFPPGRE